MTATAIITSRRSNACNIFILLLTVISPAVMVLMQLPLRSATKTLHGSIPTIRGLEGVAILRLARLSRFARVTRLLRGQNKKQLVHDLLQHWSQYAVFITAPAAEIVLTFVSVAVLQAVTHSDSANIRSDWDTFWRSFVTITTVGYGDRYPVTVVGRIGAMFVMLMGVGVIGALASILSSVLIGSSSAVEGVPDTTTPGQVEQEIAGVKNELSALQQLVERLDARSASSESPDSTGGMREQGRASNDGPVATDPATVHNKLFSR